LLLLDIFSSDSVPLHMLTREAFATYRSRLGPRGVIAFNISNTHMQLADVVASSAATNGMVTVVKRDGKAKGASHETLDFPAEIALVAQSDEGLRRLQLGPDWRSVTLAADSRVWKR
jgi:hypothetical protein